MTWQSSTAYCYWSAEGGSFLTAKNDFPCKPVGSYMYSNKIWQPTLVQHWACRINLSCSVYIQVFSKEHIQSPLSLQFAHVVKLLVDQFVSASLQGRKSYRTAVANGSLPQHLRQFTQSVYASYITPIALTTVHITCVAIMPVYKSPIALMTIHITCVASPTALTIVYIICVAIKSYSTYTCSLKSTHIINHFQTF